VESQRVKKNTLVRSYSFLIIPIFTNQESEKMMMKKINYIYQNPVKHGYVDEAEHWQYSSARDYNGLEGLLEIKRLW
jgi:hypothetical protein